MPNSASDRGQIKMVELIVSDRASIERGIVVKSAYVVISIHDPDKPRPRIPKSAGLRDVLYLAFHDAEPATEFDLPSDIVLMTADHARQIWSFVQQHLRHVGTIVCQCERGMSRSPAVAAALADSMSREVTCARQEGQPNQLVYQVTVASRPVPSPSGS